ncbi:mastermind-like protein 2 [Bufo bufo]|uniref:mastermind-like protein 2 n=1 Tax=Bufo bufo TaxID=8384 RepID=UPI001ABE5477|nr:mastermind-like protein 2 [Bufo bufo]
MGETAPPQAPAGSLAIGVSNVGLLGGGTVAPRLHSAIVERLRARIAVCRQHHLNCEGRYDRSRAESSDRERENTLQLLTLVQHGQGSRKTTKHSKSSCAAPPDYRHHQPQQPQLLADEGGDVNGGQQASNGLGQRNSALIALQGSLKRRLVVNVSAANNKRPNGVSDDAFLDFKKIKSNECISMGPNMYHAVDRAGQSVNGAMPMDQAMHRKNGNIASNDLFNTTLKDIKKEPGENISCSKHIDSRLSHENMFRFGDDNEEQLMDPELQELFNEFTYISVPPMSDLELQNMINITIKQDEPFNIDIGQQNQRINSSIPMDKVVIKSEYSQCLNPNRVSSPQMRPSSTGPTFSMSSSPLASSPSTAVAQNQGQSQVSSCVNRMNNWQELSHAQQLKQMAVNRQHNLIQQHQPNTSSNWSNVPPTGQSTRQYGLEKVPSPFRQQQLSPHGTSVSTPPGSGSQQKAIGNYLYKSSSPNNPAEMMKPQDTNKNSMTSSHLPADHHLGISKPLFHYSPDQSNQQVSSVLGTQPKPGMQFTQQPQSSASAQHDSSQQGNTVSNQSLPRSSNFQQKMMPKISTQSMTGLQYPPVHQQQDQQCNTTSLGTSSSAASCSSPNGYNTQQALLNQQMMEKTSIMQRQMQQQMLSGTEKCNKGDQLSRHLTRPPPDYKDQRRSTVGVQQATQFTGGLPTVGVNPDPTLPNSPSTNLTPQNQTHSTTNHGSRMPPLQGSPNMYGNVPCPQQPMYNGINQTSPNQMGTIQNGTGVPRQPTVTSGTNMSPFGTQSGNNGPPFRPNGPTSAGQRPQNVINNSPPTQKWMSPEVKRQDMVGYTNTNQYSNHTVQGMIGHQQFPQRALSMPNQVNPGVQMTPLNTMAPSNSGQTIETLRGFNHGQSPLRSQMLPSMSQGGGGLNMPANTFNSSNQISRAFPRSDSTSDLGSYDFLSQNGGLGSSPNGDSDFIDALLKTGHINDDWMKDINLDEILKGHS